MQTAQQTVSGVFLPLLLITAVAAASFSYGGIALAFAWLKGRAIAKPNQRSSHTVPTPQGAGIVIVPSALVTGALALALSGNELPGGTAYLASVGIAALALTVIGFLDDMHALGVASRLFSQIVAVGIAIALMPADLRILPPDLPLAIERVLLMGAVLWFVNLFNFMDGIDLISAVETVAIAIGIVMLALIGAVPPAYGVIAGALTGAMLGFVPWNAPPARLFLGDAGSIPIGFLLGLLLIHVATHAAMAAAIILPLYYLADATITLFRRLARGERVWEAHRQHFYQQATRNGFSVREIVACIGMVDVLLVLLALAAAVYPPPSAAIAVLIAAAVVAWILRGFARGRN
jgi:UDP-N-acetylmuramyl pentapeptide phosphotransferase/UDP-N-acetylglucosamine-1-phosphate transferase